MTLKEKIIDKIELGVRPMDIAAELGCSRGYVSMLSKEGTGTKRMTTRHKIQIAFLWGAGELSIPQIAEKVEIGERRISDLLRYEGLL